MTKLFATCDACQKTSLFPVMVEKKDDGVFYVCRKCTSNILSLLLGDRTKLLGDLEIVWMWLVQLFTERSGQWVGPKKMKA